MLCPNLRRTFSLTCLSVKLDTIVDRLKYSTCHAETCLGTLDDNVLHAKHDINTASEMLLLSYQRLLLVPLAFARIEFKYVYLAFLL